MNGQENKHARTIEGGREYGKRRISRRNEHGQHEQPDEAGKKDAGTDGEDTAGAGRKDSGGFVGRRGGHGCCQREKGDR